MPFFILDYSCFYKVICMTFCMSIISRFLCTRARATARRACANPAPTLSAGRTLNLPGIEKVVWCVAGVFYIIGACTLSSHHTFTIKHNAYLLNTVGCILNMLPKFKICQLYHFYYLLTLPYVKDDK